MLIWSQGLDHGSEVSSHGLEIWFPLGDLQLRDLDMHMESLDMDLTSGPMDMSYGAMDPDCTPTGSGASSVLIWYG